MRERLAFDDAGRGDGRVNEPEGLCRLGDARGELFVFDRTGRFRFVKLHTADAEERQYGYRHDDDAEASEPVEGVTPEVERRRKMVEAAEHR